jgi:hypothetical protein
VRFSLIVPISRGVTMNGKSFFDMAAPSHKLQFQEKIICLSFRGGDAMIFDGENNG